MSWTENLYLFVVLFLIIFRTYIFVRRALAFGARVRGLDHYATRTAQRLSRERALLNYTSTCDALVWLAHPPPPHSLCLYLWMCRTCHVS